MKLLFKNIVAEIRATEDRISAENPMHLDEAYQMTVYLKELLTHAKSYVVNGGILDDWEIINFFRNIKPHILGKLIYYNKVYRIESSCPVSNGKIYHTYYSRHFHDLKNEYKEYICNSDFYRYYRSGRTDRDKEYFMPGKIDYHHGLNSFVFEIDTQFSTYYDYKVARIIANELLYTYLLTKINPEDNPDSVAQNVESNKDVFWTDSKNAIIELIYALYAACSISHGKIGIRKIALIFQILFRIPLTDIHHAFHRMKSRTGSRTTFLDHLKSSLEEYMDKDI